MCILIYYASQDNSLFSKKTIEFIKKNEGAKVLVCDYIIEWDLPKWIKRQNILLEEVIKKIKDADYNLEKSGSWNSLYPREKQKAEKLIFKAQHINNKTEFVQKLINFQKDMEIRIFYFIKQKAEKVIQISEIDESLKSQLLTYLENNISDANIITSGVQEHNKKELILLTGDKNHWKKENLEWAIPQASVLSKKYSKIPEIKYIQDF